LKLLFVHDHIFYTFEGSVYSTGGLPAKVWHRYLLVFGSIIVIGRNGGELNSNFEAKKLVKSDCPGVEFELLDNFSSIIKSPVDIFNWISKINGILCDTDHLILRVPSHIAFLAFILSKRKKFKVITEVVDCPFDSNWYHGSLIRRLFSPVAFLLMRYLVSRSDYSIYVTKFFLQRRYPSSGITTYCSNVDIDMTVDFPASGLNDDLLLIGMIGTLKGNLKGVQTAIQALPSIIKKNSKVQLRVLGNGDPSRFIELAKSLGVEKYVFFDGSLPAGTRVMQWIDSLDIYIHPSFKEGLPRSLIEAMSRGKPCIASNIAGIPELIPNEWLIAPGDVLKLSKLILKISESKKLGLELGKENIDRSKQYLSKTLNNRRNKFLNLVVSNSQK
jgi:glycosyltransferase involved in cell wall biosynthesis